MKTTDEVLATHVDAFLKADVDRLVNDYTDSARMIVNDAEYEGKEAVRGLYAKWFGPGGDFQPGTYQGLALDSKSVDAEKMHIKWHMDSSERLGEVKLGTDTFVLDAENKIVSHKITMQRGE